MINLGAKNGPVGWNGLMMHSCKLLFSSKVSHLKPTNCLYIGHCTKVCSLRFIISLHVKKKKSKKEPGQQVVQLYYMLKVNVFPSYLALNNNKRFMYRCTR